MGRVVDGRVNGAPFAGIVLTAGSVLRADDAAGPVLSKKMEDAPIAGWYTIDGGQTPEDDIIEVKRETASPGLGRCRRHGAARRVYPPAR